jgi:hypothetical protein
MYINFVIRIIYLTTCIILQDDSWSTEDQPRAAEHPYGSGEDPSGHETEFVDDPSEYAMVKYIGLNFIICLLYFYYL